MAASDARTFAGLLAAQDDASLVALLTARRVPLTVGWTDFFDVADALLDPSSLVRGLAALPRADAEALQRALDAGEPVEPAEIRARLLIAGLVDADGRPYDAVSLARALVADTASPEPETSAAEDAARAAERAFAASTSLADVLQCALTEPLGRIGSGALGATDRRRLTEAGAVDDADGADELIAIAESAGLVVDVDRRWLVTSAGAAWLSMGTVTRWRTVAERLRDALPAAVRTPTGGWIPVSDWPGAHPLDPAWPATATRTRALLTRWAVLGPDGTTADWAEGLAQGTDADEAALQALLPPEVDRVFLQNDLTAIAPGPLEPRLDMRLRTMARRESRAQASTYRFTAETLSSALTAGETADSVREFLTEVSLTGVPQPLAYEIERSARRHGTVRVGTDWSGRTRVRTDDAALLQAIAVDQALRPLALVADGEDLVTRSGPDTTYWMLADARYPVTAVDADGIGRALDRHRIAPEPEPELETPGRYAPLVARLRAAHDADADSAWLERELDQAVRGHAVLIIVVRLPDGSEREITMEATGLGGGRLRGRDRGADVERTLPVSSIVSVRAA